MSLRVDAVTRVLLAVIALALVWLAFRSPVLPATAESGREVVSVNLDRIGGHLLIDGVIPVRCLNPKR